MKLSQALYPERLEQALIDGMPEMVTALGGDVNATQIHHTTEVDETENRKHRTHFFSLPGPQNIKVRLNIEEMGSRSELRFQVQDLLGRWLTIHYSIDNAMSYNMKLEIGHHPAMPAEVGVTLLNIIDNKLTSDA